MSASPREDLLELDAHDDLGSADGRVTAVLAEVTDDTSAAVDQMVGREAADAVTVYDYVRSQEYLDAKDALARRRSDEEHDDDELPE